MQTKNLAFIHRIVEKNNFWDIDIKNIKPPSPPPPPCYRQWGGFPQCKCWKCDWSKLSDSVCEIGQSELFIKKTTNSGYFDDGVDSPSVWVGNVFGQS